MNAKVKGTAFGLRPRCQLRKGLDGGGQSDAPAGTAVRDKKTGCGGRVRLYRV